MAPFAAPGEGRRRGVASAVFTVGFWALGGWHFRVALQAQGAGGVRPGGGGSPYLRVAAMLP